MKSDNILIHTHFHGRRTGVTRSVENIFPFLAEHFQAFILGYGINGPKISLGKLIRMVFSKKHLIIHCHRNNEIIFALFLRLMGANLKLISTRHAETKPSPLTLSLLRKSDVVITLTEGMSKMISVPSVVIGHGVDEQFFQPIVKVRIEGIKQNHFMACIGRVREAKGQKALLEVLSPVLQQFPDWALAIVGKADSPGFMKELKNIVTRNSVDNQVYFIDELSDIEKYYQAAHTVIIPSFSEGFSLVCLEAMSCGCNVIASKNVGIHSKVIRNEVNGYLFDHKRAEDLSALLQKLFMNELPHCGDEARKEIIKHWTAREEAQLLANVYLG